MSPVADHTANVVTSDILPTVQIDGVVWAQVITGTGANAVDWVGGNFANARPAGAAPGTQLTPRANILAFNLTTGALINSIDPSTNGEVVSIAASPDGTRIYVGGDFTTAGGVAHNHLAAFNSATGAVINSFNPSVDARVSAIVASGSSLYIGGRFASVGGVTRTRLAAVVATSGALLPWSPTANFNVNAMVLAPDKSRMIVGGAFETINGAPAYGLAAIRLTDGTLLPWQANQIVMDAGNNAAIESLSTDGTSIYGTGYVYGPGGNLEGSFSANPTTGALNWVEDCHGDTYSNYEADGVLYTASHAHNCASIGGFFESDPLATNQRRTLAFTVNATGTVQHNTDPKYADWAGNPSPSLINWFPDFTTGSYTGQGQAAWSVTGEGPYVVEGGEFPDVNYIPQQGLVRFAIAPIGTSLSGLGLSGAKLDPTLTSRTPGTVRVSFPADWDRENLHLTYQVVRDGGSGPVFTTTVATEYWNTPKLGFTDTGLAAGVHSYRVLVTDPDGNTASSDTVSVTVPTTYPALNQYAQDVLADGAHLYWRFDEPAGSQTVYDWVGYNDLATFGPVGFGSSGAIVGDSDSSATFDGTSSYATTTNPVPGPNEFTESAWFETTSKTGGKIVGFGSNDLALSVYNSDRSIYMDTNGWLYFGVSNGVKKFAIRSTTKLNDGSWHLAVASLSVAGMVLYVDGQQIGVNTGTKIGFPHYGYWRIGGDTSWLGGNYFAGGIDDVAIYPTPLTPAQVQQQWVDSGR